jgi:hypothetical protein
MTSGDAAAQPQQQREATVSAPKAGDRRRAGTSRSELRAVTSPVCGHRDSEGQRDDPLGISALRLAVIRLSPRGIIEIYPRWDKPDSSAVSRGQLLLDTSDNPHCLPPLSVQEYADCWRNAVV